MDIATIIGIVSAFTLIIMGMKTPVAFINVESILIVVGGTLAATLIANPLSEVFALPGIYMRAIKISAQVPSELIEKIVGFAETARREGILALEQAVEEADDAFLSDGVRLAVDGTEPDLIADILDTELTFLESRHKFGQELFQRMGDTGPAFGMIGTLIGLVLMLQSMEDPSAIGPAMAVALLTTLYGAIMAQVLFLPVAAKLKTYSDQEILSKKMIIEGIMSIQQGDNPRIVEHKLSVFLAPSMRPSIDEGAGGGGE